MNIMILSRLFCNLCANLTISVALVAVVGDYLTRLSTNQFAKALCDNITHAVIGGLCWVICYINRDKTSNDTRGGFFEILYCTIMSSAIDLDHFIHAKSIYLKDATRLRHRPFLHCSTIPLLLFPVLLVMSYILDYLPLQRGSLIILTAFTTHHLRDASRRGMWFYPYGSTPPIPYWFYIILTCLVPYVIMSIDRFFKASREQKNLVTFHI